MPRLPVLVVRRTAVDPGAAPSAGSDVPPLEDVDLPRRVSRVTSDDALAFAGSGASSLALVWIAYERLLPFSGTIGFVLLWFVAFLALLAISTWVSHDRAMVIDRLVAVVVIGSGTLVFAALATTIVYTFVEGARTLTHLSFYTTDMSGVSPAAPIGEGGILHAIVGTLVQIAVATVIALPLGIGTAVYLAEVGGRGSRTVRAVVEAMTALPEILAGLFVYVVLVVGFGMPKSGLAVSIAIAVTMVPIIARSAEVSLRIVPGGLREAGLALGASRARTVRSVVLPAALPGLATALILAVARGVGETAVPLLLSGASSYLTVNPAGDPMNSLTLYAFQAVRSGQPLAIERAFGAASVLLAIVLVLFAAIRFLSSRSGVSR